MSTPLAPPLLFALFDREWDRSRRRGPGHPRGANRPRPGRPPPEDDPLRPADPWNACSTPDRGGGRRRRRPWAKPVRHPGTARRTNRRLLETAGPVDPAPPCWPWWPVSPGSRRSGSAGSPRPTGRPPSAGHGHDRARRAPRCPFSPVASRLRPIPTAGPGLPGYADFNQVAADGCEAHSDYQAGLELSCAAAGERQPRPRRCDRHVPDPCVRRHLEPLRRKGAGHPDRGAPEPAIRSNCSGTAKSSPAQVSVAGQPATAKRQRAAPALRATRAGWAWWCPRSRARSANDFRLTRSGSW